MPPVSRCPADAAPHAASTHLAPPACPPPAPSPCHSLRENEQLEELSLLGNPCTRWPGYRAYVVAVLPHLQRLDSEQVMLLLVTDKGCLLLLLLCSPGFPRGMSALSLASPHPLSWPHPPADTPLGAHRRGAAAACTGGGAAGRAACRGCGP